MMYKLVIIIAIVILSSTIYCQTAPEWQWAKQAGGVGIDSGNSIAIDANGNSYVIGMFQDIATFGLTTLVSSGELDIFVAKLDVNGNYLWAKLIGGLSNDYSGQISTDINGNCLVTGSFQGTATFGIISLYSSGNEDVFVAKLDTNGNWLWAKQAGGIGIDRGADIVTNSNGNSFVTGIFEGTATFGTTALNSIGLNDAYVAKLDTNGNWLWTKQAGGIESDRGRSIASDSSGNCYVTGTFLGNAILGLTTLNSNGNSDIFTAKLDSNGNYLWAKQAGGSGADISLSIASDYLGNSFLTGCFGDTATFDTTTLTCTGGVDIFIAKIDANGNCLWAKQAGGIGTDYSFSIAPDNSGNCFITGWFEGTSTFGSTLLVCSGYSDMFIAKLDINGNYLWAMQATCNSWDKGYGIATDSSGNCYVTGEYWESATFGTTTLVSIGDMDIFIVKLSSDGVLVTDELIPPSISGSYLSNAYPNPFQRDANCMIKAEIPLQEKGILSIYNLRGQVVESHQLTSGAQDISFSGKDLAPGIYFYRLKTPTINEVKKLILLH